MVKLKLSDVEKAAERYLYGTEVNYCSCKKRCMLFHIVTNAADSTVWRGLRLDRLRGLTCGFQWVAQNKRWSKLLAGESKAFELWINVRHRSPYRDIKVYALSQMDK